MPDDSSHGTRVYSHRGVTGGVPSCRVWIKGAGSGLVDLSVEINSGDVCVDIIGFSGNKERCEASLPALIKKTPEAEAPGVFVGE